MYVGNSVRYGYKHLTSKSDFFSEPVAIHKNKDLIIFKRVGMEDKRIYNFSARKNSTLYETELKMEAPNGVYEFEEDLSNEDQKVIYIGNV